MRPTDQAAREPEQAAREPEQAAREPERAAREPERAAREPEQGGPMAAASTQRTARTPDGRTLAIEEAGDPGGRPVLVHNGTPNSRHLYAPIAADAAARGRRLIGYDRPGYGGSTPQPAAPWLTARPASVPSGGSLVTQAEQSGCEGYVVVPPPRRISGVILYCMLAGN